METRTKLKYILEIALVLIVAVFIFHNAHFTSTQSSAKSIMSECASSKQFGNTETCYSTKFHDLAFKSGYDYSFKTLGDLQKIDPSAIGCHLIAHGIGRGSYDRDPNSWQMLIRNISSSCNYGAIHGILEGHIESLPDHSLTKEIVPTICGEHPRADCNHIVGHLILVETEGNVDKALNLCSVFNDNTQRDFCDTGVFMEYQTALNLVEHGIVPKAWLDWSNRLPGLEKICRSYDGYKAEACWQEIVHVALVKFNNDPAKIFAYCDTAQVSAGAQKCKRHSIGIMGAAKNFDLFALKSMCSIPQKNDPSFQNECYPDLVSSALSTVPEMLPQAVSFCSSLEEKFKPSCFSMIGYIAQSGTLSKNNVTKSCLLAPQNMQSLCLGENINQHASGSSGD